MITQPKRDILLIEVDKPKTQTASGIYITEEWKTLPPTGKVIAVGPDVKEQDLVGKRVLFERYSSIILPKDEDGAEHRLCIERNILAEIIEDGA